MIDDSQLSAYESEQKGKVRINSKIFRNKNHLLWLTLG